MTKTKIALVQMKMTSDSKKNKHIALKNIKKAVKKGAKIIAKIKTRNSFLLNILSSEK